jgi:hypothetical protein
MPATVIIFNMKTGLNCAWAAALIALVLLTSTGCACTPNDPLGGKIYTTSPATDTGETGQPAAITVPQPAATTPAQSKVQEVERQITVTRTNSEFTIGLPAGYTEEREISASKPVDIWFQYITPDMSLVVNGDTVQVPERRSMSKLGLVQGVTHLRYVLKNLSANYLSYSLRIMPATQSGDVPVTTREKWTAP